MNTPQNYRPGQAWLMAAMLFVFIVVNFADKVVLGLVAVPMMDELKFTPSEFGLIGSSFFWFFAISGISGGFLADRIQTKWFLLAMALTWSLTQLPIIYGATLGAFIFARVLLGIGEGPAWPVAVHSIYKWFPDDKRNLPVALFSQGGAVGLLLAGLTIPLVTAKWGWRASFVGLAIFGLAWGVVWLLLGREGPIDAHGSGGHTGVREQPLKRVLADATVWGNFLMHFVAYWSLAGALTWLPAYFQKGLGFENVAAGRMYGLVVAVSIPLVLLSSWWSQRLLARGWTSRSARGRFSSLWLVIAGLAFLPLLLPGLPAGARIATFAVALGFTPAIYALGPAMLAQVSPANRRGALLALDNSIASLAGLLLIARGIVGWIVVDPERSVGRLNAPEPAAQRVQEATP